MDYTYTCIYPLERLYEKTRTAAPHFYTPISWHRTSQRSLGKQFFPDFQTFRLFKKIDKIKNSGQSIRSL